MKNFDGDDILKIMGRAETEHLQSEIDKAYRDDFPLVSHCDFDLEVCGPWFPVGIMKSYPGEFVERVAAAGTSFRLGIRSIDYFMKAYPSKIRLKKNEECISSQFSKFFDMIDHHITDTYKNLGDRSNDPEGLFIADLNIIRMRASLKCTRTTANRGFYFETMTLARFCLEQIAWIWVCSSRTHEQAAGTLATNCISFLKPLYPSAGRLYGFLSGIHHWNPDHHHLFITDNKTSNIVLWAQSRFKAHALCIVIIIYDILAVVFDLLYEGRKSEAIAMTGVGGLDGDREAVRLFSSVMTKFAWDHELSRLGSLFSCRSAENRPQHPEPPEVAT